MVQTREPKANRFEFFICVFFLSSKFFLFYSILNKPVCKVVRVYVLQQRVLLKIDKLAVIHEICNVVHKAAKTY